MMNKRIEMMARDIIKEWLLTLFICVLVTTGIALLVLCATTATPLLTAFIIVLIVVGFVLAGWVVKNAVLGTEAEMRRLSHIVEIKTSQVRNGVEEEILFGAKEDPCDDYIDEE